MRIFDTFPFDAELELLEHRLAETWDLVDAFVIVESDRTYSGEPKELTFDRNRERFAWAEAKIRHIKLRTADDDRRTPRERAAAQRDAIRLALRDAAPDDIVLLLDADEIVSREVLVAMREHGLVSPHRLLMTRHYEHPDALAPRSPCCPSEALPFQCATPRVRPGSWSDLPDEWFSRSGVATPFRELASVNAFDLRHADLTEPPLPNAGRHYSSVDAPLERKLSRVFHTEWSGARETRPAHLRRCRAHGVHHRGWWYAERPDGALPEDVARLAARLHAGPPFPPAWRRRAVRTWAWMRLWRPLPEALVARIDDHFDRLLPLMALPLMTADAMRAVGATVYGWGQPSMTKPRPDSSCANS